MSLSCPDRMLGRHYAALSGIAWVGEIQGGRRRRASPLPRLRYRIVDVIRRIVTQSPYDAFQGLPCIARPACIRIVIGPVCPEALHPRSWVMVMVSPGWSCVGLP